MVFLSKGQSKFNITIEEMIDRYGAMIYRLAYSYAQNKSDTEDIYQEVFLRYIKYMPVFKDEQHCKAWLLKVTVNCCRQFHKAKNKQKTSRLDDVYAYEPQTDDIGEILKLLPTKYRVVLYLFYYEGYSCGDIGKLLKIKSGTVKSQLHRGRDMLQNQLKGVNDYEGIH